MLQPVQRDIKEANKTQANTVFASLTTESPAKKKALNKLAALVHHATANTE